MTIYILVLLAFLTHVGFGGSRLAVPLFAIDQGATPFIVGTITALCAAFPVVLAMPAGRLSDRVGFRIPLVFGTSGVCVALLLPYIWPSLATLYFTSTLLGIGFMALQLGTQALAGAITTPEGRARNFNLLSLGFASANFVGPLLTGFLIDEIGYALTFAALALPLVPAIIISAFGSRWLPAAEVRIVTAGGSALELLKIKPLRDTLIASAIVSGAWDAYQFIMPIYGRAHALSATAIGVIMSAFAVSIILVRVVLPFAARRLGEARLLTYAMFVASAAFCLFPFFHSLWPLAAVSFLLGIGCGCGQPLSMTMVFNATPTGRAGEATGMRITANQITHTVVPLLFGALGSAAGHAAVFLTNAAGLVAGGYVSWRSRSWRKRE